VAKRRESRYEPGQRSGAWLKMRVNRGQEFVIGGYTRGTTTFVLTREALPMWAGSGSYPDDLRRAMQAHIEAAYRRPANDPRIELPARPVTDPAQRALLRQWGLPTD